jgi:hypothetical protein
MKMDKEVYSTAEIDHRGLRRDRRDGYPERYRMTTFHGSEDMIIGSDPCLSGVRLD